MRQSVFPQEPEKHPENYAVDQRVEDQNQREEEITPKHWPMQPMQPIASNRHTRPHKVGTKNGSFPSSYHQNRENKGYSH
jgi:hypothetical protein